MVLFTFVTNTHIHKENSNEHIHVLLILLFIIIIIIIIIDICTFIHVCVYKCVELLDYGLFICVHTLFLFI